MEIQVKVIDVLPVQTFTSAKTGNSYAKYTFICETQGQYPKKIAFTVMGDDKFKSMGIAVGGTYNVFFDVESREWKERWFTECSAWKAVRIDGVQSQGSGTTSHVPTQDAATGNGDNQKKDDLPF